MTSRDRMLVAMRGGTPDMVPVAPDMSNMIPCRLTGKPFWDVYLYQDPPLWQAYIEAVKRFGFDGWLCGVPVDVSEPYDPPRPAWREAIVTRTQSRIYTRLHRTRDGNDEWTDWCNVYYIADSPTHGVPLSTVGLPAGTPSGWEDVVPRTSFTGPAAFHEARRQMGEHGVVALADGLPGLGLRPENVYQFYDDPEAVVQRCRRDHQAIVSRVERYLALKPDFVLIGISGFMITNPEPIFRQLALGCLKEIAEMCRRAGVPSQIHCCGPERDLVRICATETCLSSINPLEPPPMGDCDLAAIKNDFGDQISLMGNLHTTRVMLHGSPGGVRDASRKAIDDAAAGGGFILSTGDQCGRDTPDANIHAMIETARNYGVY